MIDCLKNGIFSIGIKERRCMQRLYSFGIHLLNYSSMFFGNCTVNVLPLPSTELT